MMKRACLGLAVTIAGTTVLLGAPLSASAFPVTNGQQATSLMGQPDFTTGYVNDNLQGAPPPSASTFFSPSNVVVDTDDGLTFVSDLFNSRVLIFNNAADMTNASAIAVLGQPDFTTGGSDPNNPFGGSDTPNPSQGCATGVNGCGLKRAWSTSWQNGVKRLWVADPDNNRVLAWNDVTSTVTNGEIASLVLGQPDFVTATNRTACGGGSAGAVTACGMSFPSAIAIDEDNNRVFVSDTNNNRVLVFDGSALTNGGAAVAAIGQQSLTTRVVFAGGCGVSAGHASPCGMSAPGSLYYDSGAKLLYVADDGGNRVLVFDTSAGVTTGMSAVHVIGQPNFTTSTDNTDGGGGNSGDTNVNACGLGLYGSRITVDEATNQLFVSDAANHRVLVFDVSTITNGEAASFVLGQPDFTTGYTGIAPNDGGSASRTTLQSPLGIGIDPLQDRVFVADGANERVLTFGANVSGNAIELDGPIAAVTSLVHSGGAVAVNMTDSNNASYSITVPPGTTANTATGSLSVTISSLTGAGGMVVSATLPDGLFKSITLPRGIAGKMCILDHSVTGFGRLASCSTGDSFRIPGVSDCSSYQIQGQLGDNPTDSTDASGQHTVQICRSSDGTAVTMSGLRHTGVAGIVEKTVTPVHSTVVRTPVRSVSSAPKAKAPITVIKRPTLSPKKR